MPEVIRPFDRPFRELDSDDFAPLISLRQLHQTTYAAKSVRTGSKAASANIASTQNADSSPVESVVHQVPSTRKELCRKLNEISKRYENSNKGPTSGLARDARWTGGSKTGNSANAALASGQRAAAVSIHFARSATISGQLICWKTRLYNDVLGSLRSMISQSRLHCQVVSSERQATRLTTESLNGGASVLLSQRTACFYAGVSAGSVIPNAYRFLTWYLSVLTQYVGSGGKSVTHGWVPQVTNLGLVSYVVVQLYEHSRENVFRAILDKNLRFRTFAFAHLSADCILRRLPGAATLSADKKTLTVDMEATHIFLRYAAQPLIESRVLKAVQELVKSRRQAAKRSGTVENED